MPKKTFFHLPDERRNEILDKAVQYYNTTPFEEISLRSLTEYLGMPMGTFYRYFTDKDELYLYLCQVMNDRYERVEGFIMNPAFESPKEDFNSEDITRFFEGFHKAPEDVQRRFQFEIFAQNGMDIHKKELMRLKYSGQLRDDVDIDLIAYMYSTITYNLNMYLSMMKIDDDDLRWQIRKYLFYSFFKYGIMKQSPQTPEHLAPERDAAKPSATGPSWKGGD